MRCHDLANQVLDRARDEGRQGFHDELARIKAEYGERDRHEAEHLARMAVSTRRNGYSLAWRVDWLKRKRGSDGSAKRENKAAEGAQGSGSESGGSAPGNDPFRYR